MGLCHTLFTRRAIAVAALLIRLFSSVFRERLLEMVHQRKMKTVLYHLKGGVANRDAWDAADSLTLNRYLNFVT